MSFLRAPRGRSCSGRAQGANEPRPWEPRPRDSPSDMAGHGGVPSQRDGRSPFGRAVEGFDSAGLGDGLLAVQERLRLAADRVREVLELEAIRVDRLEDGLLHRVVPAELDYRPPAVPRIVQEQRSLGTEDLELVPIREPKAQSNW